MPAIPPKAEGMDTKEKKVKGSAKPRKSKTSDNMKTKRSLKIRTAGGLEDPLDAGKKALEPPVNHVYVYMQLQKVESLPKYCDGPERQFIIELSHQNANIQKLKEPFDDLDVRLNLNEKCRCSIGDFKLTFTVRIQQDSFDEMNVYSDCPIIVTVYQLTPAYVKGLEGEDVFDMLGEMEDEAEWENEVLEPIAMGYIDLFQYFSQRRALDTITHFVYPLKDRRLQAFKMTWHIYTLLPLLKKNTFENVIFLEFESIFNAHKDIMDDCEDVVLDLSLRSTQPNKDGEYDKYKICSYIGFHKETIQAQDENYIWASMKSYEPVPGTRLCQQSGLSFNKYQQFKDILGTEFVEFGFDQIDLKEDCALICNAVHRFILNNKLAKLLEEAITCSTQELLLEVYRFGLPNAILLSGTADLAILTYPTIQKIRFIIELHQMEGSTTDDALKGKAKVRGKGGQDKQKSSGKESGKSKRKSGGQEKGKQDIKKSSSLGASTLLTEAVEEEEERTIFASMSICLLYPIGEGNKDLVKFNESEGQKDLLKTCREVAPDQVPIDSRYCEECYRNFDHAVLGIINDIIRNNITDLEKCPGFFCCHMSNMTNRITKLIACDFNRRCPTSTSIEFANLMTSVYGELECRTWQVLDKCSADGLENCAANLDEEVGELIAFFNLYKYTAEADETAFSEFILAKIRRDCNFCYIVNFYQFLYDVEKQDFPAALQYLDLPLSDKDVASTYYADLIDLYIKYKKVDMSEGAEDSPGMELDELLENLIAFANRYPKDIDMWIILYCYYHRSNYKPGMEYTRWKFENLYLEPQRILAYTPMTLWDMHYSIDEDRDFENIRNEHFFRTFIILLNIGVYDFAETVFELISHEFGDFENYCITNTFRLLEQEDFGDFKPKSFNHRGSYIETLKAVEDHSNGNIKYYMNDVGAALNFYENIISADIDHYEPFELGLLRCGFENLKRGNDDLASRAFNKLVSSDALQLIAVIGKGKALYNMGKYSSAEYWFAECTKFDIYIPDVWAWLALINLKTNNNYKALECWKHARLDPETAIDETVLDELDKIDIMDVFLYVDLPNPNLEGKVEEVILEVENLSDKLTTKGFAKKYC